VRGYTSFAIAGYICILWLTGMYVTRKSRSAGCVPHRVAGAVRTLHCGPHSRHLDRGRLYRRHGPGFFYPRPVCPVVQGGIWIAMVRDGFLLPRVLAVRRRTRSSTSLAGLYDRKTTRWQVSSSLPSPSDSDHADRGRRCHPVGPHEGGHSYNGGMVLTTVVFTLYNVMGGFVATAYTNLIHICAIVFGIFLGGFYVIFSTGGLQAMAGAGHYYTAFGDLGVSQALSWAFINFTLGVLAQPVINTASSAKTLREGKKGIVIGNIIAIPVVIWRRSAG